MAFVEDISQGTGEGEFEASGHRILVASDTPSGFYLLIDCGMMNDDYFYSANPRLTDTYQRKSLFLERLWSSIYRDVTGCAFHETKAAGLYTLYER